MRPLQRCSTSKFLLYRRPPVRSYTRASTKEVLEELRRYYDGWWNKARRFGVVAICAGGGLLVYYLPTIRSYFSQEVVEITSQTLEDQVVQAAIQQLSRNVVHALLSKDENIREAVIDLIRDVIKEPTTYKSLRELIVWLLRQDWIVDGTTDIAVWNTHEIIDDPWIQNWLQETVLAILVDFLSHEEFAKIINDDMFKGNSSGMDGGNITSEGNTDEISSK
eukprot:CAMPEP_0185254386 /NCGR_PEP_ID=MMETSP1359-20130426/3170_1 /TAXON_ID=552665 /ORGANISM="Bigelowiella longifila, Strain CCMP242" /LENGTH=220 /DNA_ID=CAMNT_0027837349 /DNA_START=1 /DNA_END=663 /DNA_ORIENTATION=-